MTSAPVDFDPFEGGELALSVPTSEAQKEIWASACMSVEANCAFNQSFTLQLCGALDVQVLRQALNELVQRHDALRASITPDGESMLVSAESTINWCELDWSDLPRAQANMRYASFLEENAAIPFKLDQGPLIRATLVDLAGEQFLLVITLHHIVADGWSQGVIQKELGQIYSSLRAQMPLHLDAPESFSKYILEEIAQVNSGPYQDARAYWLEQFSSELPVLDLPLDFPRPKLRSYRGGSAQRSIGPILLTGLKDLARQTGSTLFSTILAAYHVFLFRLSGQTDLVVGIPIAGQSTRDYENLVGHCVNLLPIRTQIVKDYTFQHYLAAVNAATFKAYEFSDFTYGRLIKELSVPRDPSRPPLIQATYTLDRSHPEISFDGLEVDLLETPWRFETFELFLEAMEEGDSLNLTFKYNASLFSAEGIARRLEEFEELLGAIVEDPTVPVSRLSIIPPEEQKLLLSRWGRPRREYPDGDTLPSVFESQVIRSPDAIAIRSVDEELTYAELNRRANQLAHLLVGQGVGKGDVVAFFMERSADMVVAIYAVLKSGGIFLPIDPAHPRDRVAVLLEDTEPAYLLTESFLLERLPQLELPVLVVDTKRDELEKQKGENPGIGILQSDLAYIIFTSGTSGKPKGVQMQHAAIQNRLAWMQDLYPLSEADKILGKTPYTFDVSLLELFWPLQVGAMLFMAPPGEHRDVRALRLRIVQENITHVDFIPTMLRQFLAEPRISEVSSLKLVTTGGEAVPYDLPQEFFEQFPQTKLLNLYGPTEAAIDVCHWSCEAQHPQKIVPIGYPAPNTSIYILDEHLQLVPMGVPAELYIGGIQLASGYYGRKDLTAQSFIANPFESSEQGYLYKTGDQARWLLDGSIEFLGRIDDQIKFHGIRIEPGEIAFALEQCESVEEAHVIMREDQPGNQYLAAYVKPHKAAIVPQLTTDENDNWKKKWEILYQAGLEGLAKDDRSDQVLDDIAVLKAWTTGEVDELQADEWMDQTIDRISRLEPKRILELGCGAGQLIFRLAGSTDLYVGTDNVDVVIDEVQRQLDSDVFDLPQVNVVCQEANDFTGIDPSSFDLVIINSVSQYLPSIDYLTSVIEKSAGALIPGGCIYVGDVQNHALLETFHASDQITRTPGDTLISEVVDIVRNRVLNEDELVIDPGYFYRLPDLYPAINQVVIKLRRGSVLNETTRFHYDAFLFVEADDPVHMDIDWETWNGASVDELSKRLEAEQPDIYGVTHLPNARISRELEIHKKIADMGEKSLVKDIFLDMEERDSALDPEDIWKIAEQLPYDIEIRWTDSGADGCFDAIFIHERLNLNSHQVGLPNYTQMQGAQRPLWEYANRPMLRNIYDQLELELRETLKKQLPDYMMPSAFVFLDQFQRTSNGKLNRQALAKPFRMLQLHNDALQLPSTPEERQVAHVWMEVLDLPQVSLHANFFELGGHSLRAIQVISRLREKLNIELPLTSIFEYPTVAALSREVEAMVQAREGDVVINQRGGDERITIEI